MLVSVSQITHRDLLTELSVERHVLDHVGFAFWTFLVGASCDYTKEMRVYKVRVCVYAEFMWLWRCLNGVRDRVIIFSAEEPCDRNAQNGAELSIALLRHDKCHNKYHDKRINAIHVTNLIDRLDRSIDH